ncbi:MAG: cytochrome c oxidase accessory protein CcoG [Pseudomonadota bacterium]|jgi:cytochrome c oxidase accessory protein FixG
MSNPQVVEQKPSIQPRSVEGRFRTIKTGILALAYATFFILPWIRWERAVGPDQAILYDIPGRRYYIFDLVVHAQDIFWLTALLFLAAVLLFFVTTLFGRVFCGYFCFQTLWMDAFRWIERKIQGDRVARLRLEKQPWDKEKIRKIGLTHAAWLFLSLWTGLSFSLYWGDAFELTGQFFTGNAPAAMYGATFILMGTTYAAAGWVKEYICMHICPYSRFQSVMFDQDTMIVSYDTPRGEGKTGRIKPVKDMRDQTKRQEAGHGDCVDCGLCVQVCPTGVDIRKGLQIGCIHCALCIDACDGIMDKQGWKRGLIRYTSEHALEGKKTQIFKLRTIGYGVATLLATVYLIWSIGNSKQLEASAVQVRNPLFVTLSDGRIQNSFEVKINNKTMEHARYHLSLENLPNAELDMGNFTELKVKADDSLRVLVKVRYNVQPGDDQKNHAFQFKLVPLEGKVTEPVIIPSHFITP